MRAKLLRVEVRPVLVILNDDGDVMEERPGQPIAVPGGRWVSFAEQFPQMVADAVAQVEAGGSEVPHGAEADVTEGAA